MNEITRSENEEVISSQSGQAVEQARILFAPPPFVPEEIFTADESELSVELLFTIAENGSATPEILQSSGYSVVDAATLDAAVRWRFAPATVDGRPVASFLRTRLQFSGE
jgi:protein TonB